MDKKHVEIYAEIQNKLIKSDKYRLCNVCGSVYYYTGNKAKHEKTLKHLYAEYVNNTMFEIERITPKKQKDEIIIIK